MAIGTPVSLGTTADAGATDPYTLSTTAVVPAGALVVLCVATGNDTTPPTFTVDGGGLTWTEDKAQAGSAGTPQWRYAVWSAPAPAGLASSTTLNLDIGTGSGTTYSGLMVAFYIEGVSLESDRVNMSDSAFDTAPDGTWDSTASATTLDNTILIGLGFHDAAGTVTSTATGSATELHDIESTDNIAITTTYRIVSAASSYGATGTWSGGVATDGAIVVAYKSSEYDGPGDPDRAIIVTTSARLR